MANHIQKVMYEGFLGADVEMRFTPAGKQVSNFSIGSTTQYKSADGETVKTTTWLRCTAWGKLAEIVNNYCGKGSHVIVEGVLKGDANGRPTIFKPKNGGEPSASFDLSVSAVRIIKGKDGGGVNESAATSTADDDNDFPF